MSKTGKIPSYRLHAASGQGIVTLNGKDYYLGKHGSKPSKLAYDRLISEWIARDRQPPPADSNSVTALLVAYKRHASAYYTKDGEPTSRLHSIILVCETMAESFGNASMDEVTPADFLALRSRWVDAKLARSTVNLYFSIAREVLRWGVERGIVTGSVWHAVKAIRTLAVGRSSARDTEPVSVVPDPSIEAVIPLLDPAVVAMVRLQVLTGMRPGEVANMRADQIDRSEAVWTFKPASHKTRHQGKVRVIVIGPKAQEILEPWIRSAGDGPIFSHKPKRIRERTGSKRDYPADSYRSVIRNACRKAGIEPWSPNQLRHNAATEIRRRFGLEAARIALGHSQSNTTEIYAERDLETIKRLAMEFG